MHFSRQLQLQTNNMANYYEANCLPAVLGQYKDLQALLAVLGKFQYNNHRVRSC